MMDRVIRETNFLCVGGGGGGGGGVGLCETRNHCDINYCSPEFVRSS
jgi:hypothetical protein